MDDVFIAVLPEGITSFEVLPAFILQTVSSPPLSPTCKNHGSALQNRELFIYNSSLVLCACKCIKCLDLDSYIFENSL